MIWTISLPCSRAGERARPTKPTHKHPAKPFPRITRQSPRIFRPGALPQTIPCALFKPSPLRGRWRGGHAAADEVSLDIHRTTGAAGKNRNISTSSGKQSLPPSPQGEGSARGGSAPPPFPYRIQKAPGHCVRGLCRASPQNLSRAAKHAQPRGSPRGQGPPRVRSIQKALGHCVRRAFCILLFSSCAFSARLPASAAGSGSRRSWR